MPSSTSIAPDFMSASKAAAFSDSIVRMEAAAKESISKPAEPPEDIVQLAHLDEPEVTAQEQSERDFSRDLPLDLKQDFQQGLPQDTSGIIIAIATVPVTPIAPGPAMTSSAPAPSITGLRDAGPSNAGSSNAGMPISTLPHIGAVGDIVPLSQMPSISNISSIQTTAMQESGDSTIVSLTPNPSKAIANTPMDTGDANRFNSVYSGVAYVPGTSQINTGAPQTQLSGDTQALLREFENSINHFERTGNSWVGSAQIVFQSSVLKGASVQITSDGKSLNILLTQLAPTPSSYSLHHQEQQLSDALTRKLGRNVTVRVSTGSSESGDADIRAADDIESQ
jgi:hypothetical protein